MEVNQMFYLDLAFYGTPFFVFVYIYYWIYLNGFGNLDFSQ